MAAKNKKKKKKGSWLANRQQGDKPGAVDGEVTSATDKTFKQLVLKAKKPVLVDFWAPWCGPCKQVGPVVEELARDYAGRAQMVKVDVDKNPKISERYNIRSIPTLMVFKDGDIYETLVGAQSKRDLGDAVNRAVD